MQRASLHGWHRMHALAHPITSPPPSIHMNLNMTSLRDVRTPGCARLWSKRQPLTMPWALHKRPNHANGYAATESLSSRGDTPYLQSICSVTGSCHDGAVDIVDVDVGDGAKLSVHDVNIDRGL